MFICMPKRNFIIHFFLEILDFKESYNLIAWIFWSITREPEFCQIWDWCCNINRNFILDYFRKKLKTKFSKNPYFATILHSFSKNMGKNEFSWEKGLCHFLNIPVIYHHTTNHTKTMSLSSEKCQTNEERQRWFYRVIRTNGVQYLIYSPYMIIVRNHFQQ